MEVEIREEADPRTQQDTTILVNNTPAYPLEDEPELIVRAEEILLVVLVLMIWVAAITMFFNRWGQIRTLEPYQPKFQQNHHRTSCPLAPLSPPHITPQVSAIPQLKQQNSVTQRMSFSKYNVNCFADTHTGLTSPATLPPHRRPRLNSVFVAGSSAMAVINTPPRRVKSAIDIQHLIINEKYRKPSLSGGPSLLPIISSYKERKPSIVIERLGNNKHQLYSSRRRPSMALSDRPMLSHYHYPQRNRKASCFIDRRHKNFISFDQSERKLSIALDRSSFSSECPQPSISFDTTPSVSFESPTVIIEHAEINHHHHHHHSIKSAYSPKFSRSLEHPPATKTEIVMSPRISLSLDTHTNTVGVIPGCDSSINSSASSDDRTSHGNQDAHESVSFDKESLVSAEELGKDTMSVTISFEDAAPLLEELKSSDV